MLNNRPPVEYSYLLKPILAFLNETCPVFYGDVGGQWYNHKISYYDQLQHTICPTDKENCQVDFKMAFFKYYDMK